MFHLTFVHYTVCSVCVAEWQPLFFLFSFFFFFFFFWGGGDRCPHGWPYVMIVFCLFVIFIYFPFWFKEWDFAFDYPSSCSLLFYYFHFI